MNRIAAATVIRGSGECRVYLDGIVQQEIQRQQERQRAAFRAELERAGQIEKSRNRLLAQRLAAERREQMHRPGPLKRTARWIVNAYALAMATAVVWGEMLGLWERIEDDLD